MENTSKILYDYYLVGLDIVIAILEMGSGTQPLSFCSANRGGLNAMDLACC